MELGADCLDWRIACDDLIFDEVGSKNLVERLESVLQSILVSPERPIIEASDDSVMICGLPSFRLSTLEHQSDSNLIDISDISVDEVWNDTESVIRTILSQVSQIPEKDISKQQTIFNLGLDSISAIKVSSLLRKRLVNLSVSEMLKAATVLEMARFARSKTTSGSIEKSEGKILCQKQLDGLPIESILRKAGIKMDSVEKILPCDSGQIYMLSTWQNSQGILFYPTFCYQSFQELDKVRLAEAWEMLCEETPILRTTFTPTENRQSPFVQIVLKHRSNSINWLAELPSNELSRPNLPDPLVSLSVFKTTLFLTIHHALYDGVSLTILIQKLQDIYENTRVTVNSEPSFENFLGYSLTTSSQETKKGFWPKYLENSHHESIPLTGSIHNIPTHQRKSLFRPGLILSVEKLAKLARASNISLQALFLAVCARIRATIYSSITFSKKECSDVVFGIYIANRSLPLQGLPKLAAPTLNLVPLLVRDALTTPIFQSAKTIQQDLHVIGNPENSQVGLWEIKDSTGITLDFFVNFLSLPSSTDEETHAEKPRWEEIPPPWDQDQDLSTNPTTNQEARSQSTTPHEFHGFPSNPVGDAYTVRLSPPPLYPPL